MKHKPLTSDNCCAAENSNGTGCSRGWHGPGDEVMARLCRRGGGSICKLCVEAKQ